MAGLICVCQDFGVETKILAVITLKKQTDLHGGKDRTMQTSAALKVSILMCFLESINGSSSFPGM